MAASFSDNENFSFLPIKICPLYRNSFIILTVYYKGSISMWKF
jgi:hypothetical protein